MPALDLFQLLATVLLTFFVGNLGQRRVVTALLAGCAIALSPWPPLTLLALIPVSRQSPGFFFQMLSLPAVLCLHPGYRVVFADRCLAPEIVSNAFNLYSVFGLNLLSAQNPQLHLILLILGTASIFALSGRFQNHLQAGAFAASLGALILPGQSGGAGAAALGLLLAAGMHHRIWALQSIALVAVVFSELYVTERWARYSDYFYRDFLYDLDGSLQPITIAMFLIKCVLLWTMVKHRPNTKAARLITLPVYRDTLKRILQGLRSLPPVPRLAARDLIILGLFAIVSFLLTFRQLGTTVIPRTGTSTDVEATIDLAPGAEVANLWLFKTRDVAQITVRCDESEDAQASRFGDIESYGWIYRKLLAPCQNRMLLKVQVLNIGRAFELILGDSKGNRVKPLRVSAGAASLFDEQDMVAGIPLQYDGVYFDESFHIDDGLKSLSGGGLRIAPAAHPFFGRAMIALAMRLGEPVPFVWRLPDALAGALLPLLVFVLALCVLRRKDAAFLACSLVLFDNARLALSRVATTDSQLVFLIVLQALGIWQWTVGTLRGSKTSWGWLVLCGISLGFAAGIKWSGVFALPVIGVLLYISLRGQPGKLLTGGMVLGGTACAAYLASYAIFFRQFDLDLVEYVMRDTARMLNFHRNFGGYVPYQSQFVEWPWINRPVAMFNGYGLPAGQSLKVFIAGNPVVWWAVAPFTFIAVSSRKFQTFPGVWFAAGFLLIMYAAWGLIGRLTYLYHFAPMIPFGAILIAAVISMVGRRAALVKWIYLTLTVAGFLVIFVNTAGVIVPAGAAGIADWFPDWFGLFDFNTSFSIAK